MKLDPRLPFEESLARCPIIAILRGLRPEEAVGIGQALVDAGLRIIEVPLNSPMPFDSIDRLVRTFGDHAIIGAGTVTTVDEVRELARLGARAVISPHTDADVIAATVRAGMISLPGILSPTDAFAALKAGAHALKLFPMEMIGASGVRALRAVLPRTTRLIAVGGIGPGNIQSLGSAGCDGFGVGSTLYRPGDLPEQASAAAHALLGALSDR